MLNGYDVDDDDENKMNNTYHHRSFLEWSVLKLMENC
jgi:hypothetical protein